MVRGQAAPREYLEASVTGMGQPQKWGGFLAEWGTLYHGITDGRWKYIWYPEGGCAQLFDLETDPHELHNVAASQPDQRERLRDELTRRRGELPARPVIEMDERDLRNFYRLGCLTETSPHDVRH